MRYVGLLVAGLLAWAGFDVLTAVLQAAGEREFLVLGRSAATISLALFTLFTLGALTIFDLVMQQRNSGNTTTWLSPLLILISAWASLYSVLTYVGVSLYAIALARVGLLGKLGPRGIRRSRCNRLDPGANRDPYAQSVGHFHTRLFVLQIPAVPLILPYLIGVNLVRRAGDLVPH